MNRRVKDEDLPPEDLPPEDSGVALEDIGVPLENESKSQNVWLLRQGDCNGYATSRKAGMKALYRHFCRFMDVFSAYRQKG